jgi:hypothetical protein
MFFTALQQILLMKRLLIILTALEEKCCSTYSMLMSNEQIHFLNIQ